MDALMLERPGRISPSSSRRIEEAVCPSGLPAQGSIAGSLTLEARREEWGACLERLGQEWSRVAPLPPHVRAPVEEEVVKGLAYTLPPGFWIGEVGLPGSCTSCVFLTSPQHGTIVAIAAGQVYLVQFRQAGSTQAGVSAPKARPSEAGEPIVPDTDHAYTVEQMARAWKSLGRAITEDDVPLSVDPDDYPLF
jgi:hypothetical protein